MRQKKKRLSLYLLALCLLMIAAVAFLLLMIGEKEPESFTRQDWSMFSVFMAVMVVSLVGMIVIAVKIRRLNLMGGAVIQPASPTKTENRQRLRSWALFVLAVLLTLGTMVGGMLVGQGSYEQLKPVLMPWIILGMALPPLLALIFWLLTLAHGRRMRQMNVKEGQSWLLSHREQADAVAEAKLALLRRLRIGAGCFAALLAVLGLADAFLLGLGGLAGGSVAVPCAFYTVIGLLRIRFRTPASFFSDVENYVSQVDFPELYALARRAQAAHGLTGPIYIGLAHDCNASIGVIGGAYSVILGVVLLGVLNKEELYHVLLHEFAHVGDPRVQKENRYFNWLAEGLKMGALSYLFGFPFCWFDGRYGFEMNLFRFADSIREETRADRAMLELGDARTGASALLKLKYVDLFEWEEEAAALPLSETAAEQIRVLISGKIQRAREAIAQKAGFYNDLARREIQSRSASHPTLRMRLESLGVTAYEILELPEREVYTEETRRAAERMEELLRKNNSEADFAEKRQRTLDRVKVWEDAGRPLEPDQYPDVVCELRNLGRMDEAMGLCQRAIEELGENESRANALYMTGCWLLHRWDPAGIDRIYAAIDCNSNYIEEGLGQIGAFCCISGNQEELDRYRELTVQLLQKEKDVYSQLSVLKKGDQLSGERLPEELAERIRRTLAELDQGRFDNIYLLHKQITPDFFTSAMVVQFRETASNEEKSQTMHRIFLLLDAVENWQFSLFDYDELDRVKPESIPGSLFYPAA